MGYDSVLKTTAGKIGGVVLFIVAAGVAKVAVQAGIGEYQRRTTDFGAEFEAKVSGDPTMGPLFIALRTNFPDRYEAFKATIVDKAKAGETSDDIRRTAWGWMRNFTREQTRNVALAPHHSLANFRQAQIVAATGLAADSKSLCAHFVMTGLRADDKPTPAIMPLIAKAGVAQIEAASAGIDHPSRKMPDAISDADASALVAAMVARGATQTELAAFASPQALAALPDSQQCDLGLTMLRSVDDLPPDQADRVTAYLAIQS